jgi:N6-adenosine-specific RNA methylase IME4
VAPEHRRLARYPTMDFHEISCLNVGDIAAKQSHCWLWTPNAMLKGAILILEYWGFAYKTNLVWYKVRKDGGPDGRGVGFYMRNVTELLLLGVRGNLRTRAAGRKQTNIIISRKREHSRKPDEVYNLIEHLSPGPYLELFARHTRVGWTQHGDQLETPCASS